MARPKLKRIELSYQYGFKAPNGDEVTCESLSEAMFYSARGAAVLVREVEVRRSEWEPIDHADPA